jgi:hypothetical protein
MAQLKEHGVPDEAKVSFSSASDGVVLTNIDFDEEVEAIPQAALKRS